MKQSYNSAKNLAWWFPKAPSRTSPDKPSPSLPKKLLKKLQKLPLAKLLPIASSKQPGISTPPLSIPGYLPPAFLDLLTRPALYKLGVNAHHDALVIYRTWGFRMSGVIDLASLCDHQDLGLQALAHEFGYDMGKRRTSGGWELDILPMNKIVYAARDAIAGLEIHRRLVRGK